MPSWFRDIFSSTRRLAIAVAVLVVLAGVSLYAWFHYSTRESTDDAQVDGHIVPIAARVNGTVKSVEVKDNQRVPAGTVLVRIDPRDYEVALARAEGELADARAALAVAEAGLPIVSASSSGQLGAARAVVQQAQAGGNVAERDIEAAAAKVAAAEARLRQATVEAERAARDRDRLKPLLDKDEVSRQQYDAATSGAAAAAAAVDSARAALAEAQQGVAMAQSRRAQANANLARAQADLHSAQSAPEQVSVARARVNAATARVASAEAAVRQAKLMLDYTTVVAPDSGIVSRRTVEPGQVVQPGQALLAIVPLEDMWITANFKETQLEHMRAGEPATISVDAYDKTFTGHVDSIAAATGAKFSLLPPENATGNYVKVVQRVPVKIVLDKGQDPEQLLRPGLSVYVTVRTR